MHKVVKVPSVPDTAIWLVKVTCDFNRSKFTSACWTLLMENWHAKKSKADLGENWKLRSPWVKFKWAGWISPAWPFKSALYIWSKYVLGTVSKPNQTTKFESSWGTFWMPKLQFKNGKVWILDVQTKVSMGVQQNWSAIFGKSRALEVIQVLLRCCKSLTFRLPLL